MIKIMRIQGKTSDMSGVHITDESGRLVVEHEGYVPDDICIGGGDDIDISIDIATGKIIDWDPEKITIFVSDENAARLLQEEQDDD